MITKTITNGNLAIDAATHHVLFHHDPDTTDGYITIAKKDVQAGRFSQYFYKPTELADHLTDIMGEDVFFSQNTFYRKSRRIETIRQLRSLYVDLDFYLFNYTPDWILGKLELEFYRQSIPEPNLIIFSGQGLVLIWMIDPVPYKALPLWQAVQNYLLEQLKPLGGDPKAADAARIFRIAGSTSSKNGAEVRVEYRHNYRYTLRDIQAEYLPELAPKKDTKPKAGRKKKVVHLYNLYSLYAARLKDLDTLVTLRGGHMTGYRQTTLFLHRYWSCCFESDPHTALQQTIEFNQEFTVPLSLNEVTKSTKGAEKAWEARSNKEANERAQAMGYPGAGYNISNAKLIDWLDITLDEQRHLSTIISTKERNRRRREAYKANPQPQKDAVTATRRKRGVKPRSEYVQAEKQKTESKLDRIRAEIAKSPKITLKQLSDRTGMSKSAVQRLKARL